MSAMVCAFSPASSPQPNTLTGQLEKLVGYEAGEGALRVWHFTSSYCIFYNYSLHRPMDRAIYVHVAPVVDRRHPRLRVCKHGVRQNSLLSSQSHAVPDHELGFDIALKLSPSPGLDGWIVRCVPSGSSRVRPAKALPKWAGETMHCVMGWTVCSPWLASKPTSTNRFALPATGSRHRLSFFGLRTCR